MKWNSSSFLENRTFDQRLVKENLIDKWNIYGDIYKTRTDYRQFLESYVTYIFVPFHSENFKLVFSVPTFAFYSINFFIVTFVTLKTRIKHKFVLDPKWLISIFEQNKMWCNLFLSCKISNKYVEIQASKLNTHFG